MIFSEIANYHDINKIKKKKKKKKKTEKEKKKRKSIP